MQNELLKLEIICLKARISNRKPDDYRELNLIRMTTMKLLILKLGMTFTDVVKTDTLRTILILKKLLTK